MLKRNIIANFLGTGYGMLLQFIMLPITLHYLGPQAYGLIGVYATILAILGVLDLGLSPALGRELARLSVLPDGYKKMYGTVSTLEVICLAAAAGLTLIIWFGAPLLEKYWFTKSSLPPEVIKNCMQWMGLQSAFQFLTNYYSSGLVGLQRIVLNNGIAASTQTLRTLILIWLLMSAPQIETYFIYQAVIGFFTLVVTGAALYSIIPKETKVHLVSNQHIFNPLKFIKNRFDHERFSASKRFAVGMAATTLSTLALTQLDKVILSKMLSLEEFGYYTIAASIAGMLAKPASLVYAAVLPRMTQLATNAETLLLKDVYLKSSALVGWLVLPAAGFLVGFGNELFCLYLNNPDAVAHVAPLASMLAIGFALHSITYVPYGLTLAYGWTRFGIQLGITGSLLLVPFIILGTRIYGAMGAAYVWGALCFLYATVFMVIIHRKYLNGALITWYKKTVLFQGVLFALIIMVGFWYEKNQVFGL